MAADSFVSRVNKCFTVIYKITGFYMYGFRYTRAQWISHNCFEDRVELAFSSRESEIGPKLTGVMVTGVVASAVGSAVLFFRPDDSRKETRIHMTSIE